LLVFPLHSPCHNTLGLSLLFLPSCMLFTSLPYMNHVWSLFLHFFGMQPSYYLPQVRHLLWICIYVMWFTTLYELRFIWDFPFIWVVTCALLLEKGLLITYSIFFRLCTSLLSEEACNILVSYVFSSKCTVVIFWCWMWFVFQFIRLVYKRLPFARLYFISVLSFPFIRCALQFSAFDVHLELSKNLCLCLPHLFYVLRVSLCCIHCFALHVLLQASSLWVGYMWNLFSFPIFFCATQSILHGSL